MIVLKHQVIRKEHERHIKYYKSPTTSAKETSWVVGGYQHRSSGTICVLTNWMPLTCLLFHLVTRLKHASGVKGRGASFSHFGPKPFWVKPQANNEFLSISREALKDTCWYHIFKVGAIAIASAGKHPVNKHRFSSFDSTILGMSCFAPKMGEPRGAGPATLGAFFSR